MKLIIAIICILAATQSFAQEQSWGKRYEAAAAEFFHNGREMRVTKVIRSEGNFGDEDLTYVEELCLQSEGIFKIDMISNDSMEIYHWAAFDEFDVRRIFSIALINTVINIESSEPYYFE